MPKLRRLLEEKQVIVTCGTGGVGKTTVSAALALAGARLGQRVLVLTIDPSRRLAEVLSIAGQPPEPAAIPRALLSAVGVPDDGNLHAWMLDPMKVADDTVEDVIGDKEMAKQFLENPIYRRLSSMTAGMQEYTAMKALHGFVRSNRFDLVILDTPPSRHALDFLDAPTRMAAFFESQVFRFFAPKKKSLFRSAAASLVTRSMKRVAGRGFTNDLMSFLAQFTGVFSSFQTEVTAMRGLLSRSESAFLVVTSPVREAVEEAFFFHDRVRQSALPFAGFILNRCHVRMRDWPVPRRELLGLEEAVISDSALEKLQRMVEAERKLALDDAEVLRRIQSKAGNGAFVHDLPALRHVGDGLRGIADLATLLLESSTGV